MPIERKSDKFKLKKWFVVYAPDIFNKAMICEIPAASEKAVKDRNVVISLDALTHNPSNMNMNIKLKINNAENGAAYTSIKSIEMLYSYIRSLIHRHKSLVNVYVPIATKDNKNIVVKLIIITRSKVVHSKLVDMRKKSEAFIKEKVPALPFDEFVKAVIDKRFQNELASIIKPIAAVSTVEMKKLEIKQ
ncbi:MAG: hypothetical protein ACP5RP_01685 [Candidatus Micrarchaeia archaeon]